jgi:hypothetical protein
MRFWDELLRRYLGGAADRLGSEQAGRARGAGRLIPFDEAVRRALGA